MNYALFLSIFFCFWNTSFPFLFYSKIEKASFEEQTAFPSLNQNASFEYIGEGAQTIAFVSKDGSTVLKIFKAKHAKPFKLHRFIHQFNQPNQKRAISAAKWDEKFRATKRRYEQAFEEMKEETGLIALHFKATQKPLSVQLIDKKHRTYTVDLKDYPFILQKRAELLPDYFSNLLKQGKLKEAKAAIEKLKLLFVNRTLKGYTDPRQSLSVNYGFIADQPIQIDVGKIERMPILKEEPEGEIRRIHAHVDHWFQTHFPELCHS